VLQLWLLVKKKRVSEGLQSSQ